MRNETSLANEVRVKLHIKCSQDTQIRNLWMCLNYDQKPSVSHIVEHIKKNFCSQNEKKSASTEPEVKLYLDDFWLPPYENSRLIRENDCVKVELNYDDEEKNYSQDSSNVNSKTYTKASYTRNWDQTVKSSDKHVETNGYSSSRAKTANSNYYDEQVDQYDNDYVNEDDYYYHYHDNNDEEAYTSGRREDNQAKYNHNQQRGESFDPFEFWSSNIQTNEPKEKTQTKTTTTTTTSKPKQQQQQQQVKETKKASALSKQDAKQSEGSANASVNCYKKFAVASYAHLLNEPVEQVTTAKPTTSTANKKTTDNQNHQQVSSNEYVDLDKIASNVNSTGKQKWKNSTKPTQSNGPKHIIFPSTESDSSSSSSSDSSDDETMKTKKKQTPAQANKVESTVNQSKTAKNQTKKQFYEPTKEEQLNMVNTNRSYTIQNTKSVNEFKKVFNETKLNAPKAEEFIAKKTNQPKEKSKQESTNKKQQQQQQNNQLNTSTDSSTTSTSSSSTSSAHSSPSKRNNHRRKSQSPAKVDFEKLAKLEGMPRVNDKLAFQILEISSNFTPEISAYKTGTVLEVDNASNEITIRLNNKYNSVLKRPNKFNVVLDETEEERMESNENEPVKMKRQNSNDNDNVLKIDWRNLMNLKLLPEESKKEADKADSSLNKSNEQQQQQHHVKQVETSAVAASAH